MVPWKSELKPSEIAQVASYVISLHGTTPADPKAPEGDIWSDGSSTPNEKSEATTPVDSLEESTTSDEPATADK